MAVGSSDVNGEVVAPVVPTGSVPNALDGAAVAKPVEPTGATVEPKYMTEDQVKILLAAQKDEFERTLQSRTDKLSSRVEKQVQTQLKQIESNLKLLESAGQVITPEIRERVRQRVITDAYANAEEDTAPSVDPTPSPSPSKAGGGGAEGGAQIHPVLEQSFQIIRGMGLDPQALSDEAAALIDQETQDEKTFLASVRKAAAFEYARVNEAGTATNGNGVPAARVAGFGSVGPRRGNPIENINDPNELFRQAFANGKL